MKKILFYFAALAIGIGFFACESEDPSPTFNVNSPQAITSPTNGAAYTFTEEQEEAPFETITWTAASVSPDELANLSYSLQMDFAGNDFSSPLTLATTDGLSYETTIGRLNTTLVGAVDLFGTDTLLSTEIRVVAGIGNSVVEIISDVVSMDITLFKAEVPSGLPLYLVGDGTAAGWDNAAGLEVLLIDDGIYEIVTELTGGASWKVLEVSGQWAPQYGTDATGTADSGPLVLRPTEDEPDPAAIPCPEMTGSYKITIDLNTLTYTVIPFGDIWLLGDATVAGWDNVAAVPFTTINEDEGLYSIKAQLIGGAFWKFIDEPGMWAPQWGTDATGTAESGPLVFRPTEDEPDPAAIPAPADDGLYQLDVDIINLTYTVTPL